MSDDSTALRRTRRSRLLGCFGCGCGVPVVAVALLVLVYAFNNRPPEIIIPTHPVPADNAYNDFVKVGKMLKVIPHKPPASLMFDPAESQRLAICKACSKDAGPALAILRRALGKPYMAPPVRIDDPTTYGSFALFRESARVIAGDAEFYARSGRPGAAAGSLLDGAEMGVMLPKGGGVIHGSVGSSCVAIAAHELEPLLPRLSRAELKQVAARLDRIATRWVPYHEVAEEEANCNTAFLLEALRMKRDLKETYDYLSETVEIQGNRPTVHQGLQMARLVLASKSRLVKDLRDYHLAIAREARRPYTGPSKVPLPSDLVGLFTAVMFLDNSRRDYVAREAVLAILRVEVALYRYRFDHVWYPDRLNLLVPNYMKTVPDDPCGGADGVPLHYSVQASSKDFLLYSLGPDLIDNHGTPAKYPSAPAGDIVAGRMWEKSKASR